MMHGAPDRSARGAPRRALTAAAASADRPTSVQVLDRRLALQEGRSHGKSAPKPDRQVDLLLSSYRITKYDPRLRDERGSFRGDDWIAFDQVGESFGGVELTLAEYVRTENAYCAAAAILMQCSGWPALRVRDLQTFMDDRQTIALTYDDGDVVPAIEALDLLRLMLRGFVEGRLDADSGEYVHVGFDYYMYVRADADDDALSAIRALGLFPEPGWDSGWPELGRTNPG
jgi:hypothetical protein